MGAQVPIYQMLHELTAPWCPVKCNCPQQFISHVGTFPRLNKNYEEDKLSYLRAKRSTSNQRPIGS